MGRPEKIRLGEILLQQKLLTEEKLRSALEEQKRSGRKLGRIFIDAGFVTEEQIGSALARQLQVPFINLKHFNIRPEVATRLPEPAPGISGAVSGSSHSKELVGLRLSR